MSRARQRGQTRCGRSGKSDAPRLSNGKVAHWPAILFSGRFSGLAYVQRVWHRDAGSQELYALLNLLHGDTQHPDLRAITCVVASAPALLLSKFREHLEQKRRLLIAGTLQPEPRSLARRPTQTGASSRMRLIGVDWYKLGDCKGRPTKAGEQ